MPRCLTGDANMTRMATAAAAARMAAVTDCSRDSPAVACRRFAAASSGVLLLLTAACSSTPALSLSRFGVQMSNQATADCQSRSAARDLVEGAGCDRAATDAGAPCTSDAECQGRCDLAQDLENGMPPTGRCSDTVKDAP